MAKINAVYFYYKDTVTGHVFKAVIDPASLDRIYVTRWNEDHWSEDSWNVHIEYLDSCIEITDPEKEYQTEQQIKKWLG